MAVIDTGVDYNHPDLKNEMWKNPGEIAGNGIDDDNNGIVDDVYGANFKRWFSIRKKGDPMDDNGHGTHCAGIQSTFGFETLDKAAALGLETATPLTDPRQYINSNLGFRNLKI